MLGHGGRPPWSPPPARRATGFDFPKNSGLGHGSLDLAGKAYTLSEFAIVLLSHAGLGETSAV